MGARALVGLRFSAAEALCVAVRLRRCTVGAMLALALTAPCARPASCAYVVPPPPPPPPPRQGYALVGTTACMLVNLALPVLFAPAWLLCGGGSAACLFLTARSAHPSPSAMHSAAAGALAAAHLASIWAVRAWFASPVGI